MPQLTISDESAALLHELREGMRAEHGDTRTEQQVVEDAISRVHRGFFGLLPEQGGPDQPTGPFRKWASDRRAEVLLRQVDPKTFRLVQPFRFDDGTRKFDVPEDDVTDLASTPRFLTWLVPRYGRHTLAALLHDHLQDDETVTSEQADVIFREAMRNTGVPLSRRWLMWSAVALRTQWNLGGVRKVRAGAWVGAFALVALVVGIVAATSAISSFDLASVALAVGMVAVAVLSPVVLSFLWGANWKLGAFGGMALLLFTIPVALVLAALGTYFAVEWIVERLFVKQPERNPVLTKNLQPDARSW